MIVLDENLGNPDLARQISAWYPGRVAVVTELRSGSIIPDEAIATLLRKVSNPTFVTLNVSDFWRKERADSHACIVCINLELTHVAQVPIWLRRFLSIPPFKTKVRRMGVVALLRPTRIEYYRRDRSIEIWAWQVT